MFCCVCSRDAEPEPSEPAFFDPTGAGAGAVKLLRLRLRSKLQKSFFNCRECLFGKYVECTSCKNYVERIKTLGTYFWPEGAPMKQFSEKTRYRKH